MRESKYPMKIFICDDEEKIVADLAASIEKRITDCSITAYTCSAELWQALQTKPCDVLFLDIDMPGMNGLDIAAKLSEMVHSPLVVFVTSHDELVYDSLKFHPFGFVRKSFMDKELEEILRDCGKTLGERATSFSFRTTEGNTKLPLEEIFYFEAEGNYLMLYTKKGSYRFRDTLQAVENVLEKKGFVRIHKGFLVNQAAVRVLGSEEVELTDGTKIPIGRNYSENAKKRILRYMV